MPSPRVLSFSFSMKEWNGKIHRRGAEGAKTNQIFSLSRSDSPAFSAPLR